jgi:class 3 adenylate cyclase
MAYFRGTPAASYLMYALLVAFNAWSFIRFVRVVGERNEAYREYQAFKRAGAGREDLSRHTGIQRRLVLSFVTIITIVIVVICGILLRDFSATIFNAVISNGESLAERTASTMKTLLGDTIAQEDYLMAEYKKNRSATFPFLSLAFYLRNPQSQLYVVAVCTDKERVGTTWPSTVTPVTKTARRMSDDGKIIEFLSPVLLGGKHIGFVSVVYEKTVIFEPYFRTQVKVFCLGAVFIYASFFVIYLIGRAIVYPLLYLRMSVNAISRTLADMISGTQRISAALLAYRDRVATRDEIKGLSLEIGNMIQVIRGVVPYISASTLKHSERERPTSEVRDLAFLFTDIRGFTTLCEGRSPEEIVTMLNHYLELQASLILARKGDIDKFVGDEIMAMFEGPDKELNACRASIDIRLAMSREKELAEKAMSHVISIGIGINSGPVVFGSVGARDRMDFTSIGDTVNLAARLESANKLYATKTLISEVVHEKIREEFLCREIDLLTVQGKTHPVRIFEIIQAREHVTGHLNELKNSFEEGLGLYRQQQWDAAARCFSTLVTGYSDGASAVFLDRIAHFKKNPPPADWNGVFVMTTK